MAMVLHTGLPSKAKDVGKRGWGAEEKWTFGGGEVQRGSVPIAQSGRIPFASSPHIWTGFRVSNELACACWRRANTGGGGRVRPSRAPGAADGQLRPGDSRCVKERSPSRRQPARASGWSVLLTTQPSND